MAPTRLQQLAKSSSTTSSPSKSKSSSPTPGGSNLSGDTMKSLSYLQQELIKLTKNRRMYDKATTTQILTQALAMTIAQVNQAAKNAGIKGSPLVSLIEKNPQHVTKILTAALNAATVQVTKKPAPKSAAGSTSSKPSTTNSKPASATATATTATAMKQESIQSVKKVEASTAPSKPSSAPFTSNTSTKSVVPKASSITSAQSPLKSTPSATSSTTAASPVKPKTETKDIPKPVSTITSSSASSSAKALAVPPRPKPLPKASISRRTRQLKVLKVLNRS
ncbi:unnamed protein product [[Candida] boidinii]|nr:unnamed protein product [[Candida] boidinii]